MGSYSNQKGKFSDSIIHVSWIFQSFFITSGLLADSVGLPVTARRKRRKHHEEKSNGNGPCGCRTPAGTCSECQSAMHRFTDCATSDHAFPEPCDLSGPRTR